MEKVFRQKTLTEGRYLLLLETRRFEKLIETTGRETQERFMLKATSCYKFEVVSLEGKKRQKSDGHVRWTMFIEFILKANSNERFQNNRNMMY